MMMFLSLFLLLGCPGKNPSPEPNEDSQEPSSVDTAYVAGFETPTRPPEVTTRTYSCSIADEGYLEVGAVIFETASYESIWGYRIDGEVLYEGRYHVLNRTSDDLRLTGRPSEGPIDLGACLIYLWEE